MYDMPNGFNMNSPEMINIQEVIDSIDDIIALCDADKRVFMLNKSACTELEELMGMKPEDLLGHTTTEVLNPLIDDGVSIVNMVAEQKRPLQKNIRYVIESRSIEKTILFTIFPLMDGDRIRYMVATGRDMTKLMILEERLAASEKLNQYYSSIVHDLTDTDFSQPIVFTSKKMEDTLKLAKRASKSDASVFITGESGVGKEEIAKYIHRNSARKDKPYFAINCAAIPKELIESELFGYVEGAFTGSKKGGKKGIVEEVDGGTLFLDEIGALPQELQSKLLRVVQEGVIRRIGANNDIKVDVRYISATNLPTKKLLDNDFFRQDLLYRLSVVPIYVSPIRERREDIIPLVEYFLSYYNTKYDRRVYLTAVAFGHLCSLPWRGNVRQIKNVVERIVILSEDGDLLKDDILPVLRLDIDSAGREELSSSVVVKSLTTLAEAQEQTEMQLIKMALDEYKTVPKAAKALGVPPSTVYRKLKNRLNTD